MIFPTSARGLQNGVDRVERAVRLECVGANHAGLAARSVGEDERGNLVPVVVCVGALIALGLYLPQPVTDLLNRIVEALRV